MGTNYGGLTSRPCLLGGFHRAVKTLSHSKQEWGAGQQEGYQTL